MPAGVHQPKDNRRDARGPGRGPSRTEHGGADGVPRGADGVELIPQPHGGYLRPGGMPGNRGGGRPPSAVRRLARLEFEKRIPTLAELADSKTERTRDRIRAIDVLGKYGLGQARGLDEEEFEAVVLELAGAVQRRLVGALPPAQADEVLAQLFEDWKEILRARRTGAAD